MLTSRDDPDYRALLAMVAAGRDALARMKRFDLAGFQPREEYLRELRRYGVLTAAQETAGPLDPYALDQAYWCSLWYRGISAPAE